nr:hypothetical protein GCM10020063_059240 [Dactylosporangium thailandense]
MAEIVWETSTAFSGRETEIDLWFDGDRMGDHVLASVVRVTADLGGYHLRAHRGMLEDWALPDSAVRYYLAEEPSLAGLSAADFVNRLHLVRIGIYPDSSDRPVVFDYTTGRDLTDNLLVAVFDTEGRLTGLTVES